MYVNPPNVINHSLGINDDPDENCEDAKRRYGRENVMIMYRVDNGGANLFVSVNRHVTYTLRRRYLSQPCALNNNYTRVCIHIYIHIYSRM